MFRRNGPSTSGAATHFGVFFLAGCALIAGAVFASADSTPRRQYRETHVGVAPSSLVVLQSGGLGGVNLKFYATHPEFGSPSEPPDKLPEADRIKLTQAITQMRDDTKPFADSEVVRELREIVEGIAKRG